jgi:hypothetical protein
MWTRDAGVFLRELVLWGRLDEARLVAGCLMDLVERNEQGFLAFPERFDRGRRGCGHEIDGTCAIVIGLVLLESRLPDVEGLTRRIRDFLLEDASPVAFLSQTAGDRPLIAGGGEFGPGCGLPGLACNAVQNHLAVLALVAAAGLAVRLGHRQVAERWRRAAEALRRGLEQHLGDERGGWRWAVDPVTFGPVAAIDEAPVNRGFGGINGILAMWADVHGLEPALDPWMGLTRSRRTLEHLRAWPQRAEAFATWGIWTQFDVFNDRTGAPPGSLSSPSYGHGYATQCFQLLDQDEDARRAIEGLAVMTYNKGQRRSPYLFHERMYCPPVANAAIKGCGELNLVCAAEPLKIARLILGVDDRVGEPLRLVPRLPAGWDYLEARDWPVWVLGGLARADIVVERSGERLRYALTFADGRRVSQVHLRMGAAGCFSRRSFSDVSHLDVGVDDGCRS